MKETTYLKYKPTKSYKGFCSVRSYIVDKAIRQGKDLLIEFNNQVMTVPNEYLKHAGQLHKKSFKSKFGNKEYQLYDFFFIADNTKKETVALF